MKGRKKKQRDIVREKGGYRREKKGLCGRKGQIRACGGRRKVRMWMKKESLEIKLRVCGWGVGRKGKGRA